MAYKELLARSFKYGMMFGKDIRPGNAVGISVTNIDDIVLAVKKAYIDMSPRTFRKEGSRPLDPEMKAALFEALAEKYAEYMQHGAVDFEDWHHKLCCFFIRELEKILADAGKDPADATYGKAQKIINMTFKYLYCFDDAAEYAERFEPCHMAIDSYILNWVKEWYPAEVNKPSKQSGKKTRIPFPYWSNMTYTSGDKLKPQYLELQREIRKWVEKEYHMPCIEAEFIIWYDERSKLSKKAQNH